MKPKCTNHIDLAIGYNFIFADKNSQIIYCFLGACIQHVLEVRYQDFSLQTACVCECFGVFLVYYIIINGFRSLRST